MQVHLSVLASDTAGNIACIMATGEAVTSIDPSTCVMQQGSIVPQELLTPQHTVDRCDDSGEFCFSYDYLGISSQISSVGLQLLIRDCSTANARYQIIFP